MILDKLNSVETDIKELRETSTQFVSKLNSGVDSSLTNKFVADCSKVLRKLLVGTEEYNNILQYVSKALQNFDVLKFLTEEHTADEIKSFLTK